MSTMEKVEKEALALEERAAAKRREADQERVRLAAEETARNEEAARAAYEGYDPGAWTEKMAAARAAFGEAVAAEPWAQAWLEYMSTYYAWHEAYGAAQPAQPPDASPLVGPPGGIPPLVDELGRALALTRF